MIHFAGFLYVDGCSSRIKAAPETPFVYLFKFRFVIDESQAKCYDKYVKRI